MSVAKTVFIGIDLSDPYAEHRRLCTRAVLTPDLRCTFDEWEYDQTGSGIVPEGIGNLQCVFAIDGPQGLGGSPKSTMRICEKKLDAAGKSPYELPPDKRPYAGFVRGSIRLFYSLYKSSNFRLYGMDNPPKTDYNLIEVYPGRAWQVLAGKRLEYKKRSLDGRKERLALLIAKGVTFEPVHKEERPPTHDQLDAAVAAYIAFLFVNGKTENYGEQPYEDSQSCLLREGLIVQPLKETKNAGGLNV